MNTTIVSNATKLSLHKLVPIFLAVTLLALPLSSTAKSICLSVSVLTILLIPAYRNDLRSLISTRWCKAAFLLFSVAVIFCLWSPATFAQKGLFIEKYSKLLYLPILVVGFQDKKTRLLSLHAFLFAILIVCSLSILKFFGFLSAFSYDADHVFRNHIMTGFMVAFASYLCCIFGLRHKGYMRGVYGLLALIFTYQVLFVSGGRTGYIIYFLLMSLLVIQVCSWKQAISGLFLLSILFSAVYFASPVMKIRMDGIAEQIHAYQENQKDTSIGTRLQFHDFAYNLFKRHPLVGNGTASFTYYFAKEKPVAFWHWKLLEPHSQYWLVAAEFGLFGVGLLLYFFLSLIQASFKLNEMKYIAFAMMIPFVLGNLSDSLLLYSGSGYFFVLFMALCLGEGLEKNKQI